MTDQLSIKNAKIVLADEVIEGNMQVTGETISAFDTSASSVGEDFEGDYLVPGLVELHTDHLENHYHPRPKVFWNATAALQAHDAQVASSGITTVFDAVRIGSDAGSDYELGEHVETLVDAIRAGKADDRLRADHFVHLRCELASSDALDHFEIFYDLDIVRLASLMDHTPGQRQFVTMDMYYVYYQGKSGRSDEEMKRFIAARIADQQQYSDLNRRGIVERAQKTNLVLASHDDATVDHVTEAKADNVKIAEFPTTKEAAAASREAGLAILMGAPNVVRGKSHSGNISATDLARDGLLDVLSSDYVPFSLMQAAFELPHRVEGIDLSAAIAKVTKNPAEAAGLDDRGEIAIGKRADFARVSMRGGVPIIRSVWRQGQRVI